MNAEQQSNESAGTQTEKTGAKHLSDLEQLGEALAENEPSSGDGNAESRGSEEKTPPTKFNDLAGATDLELDALYKLEISLDDDDEPVTIEQLKDSYKQRTDFDVKQLEFEEQRTQQTNELMRERAEIQALLAELPANAVKPDVLQKIRSKNEQTAKLERQRTLDAIPEWKDDTTRQGDIEAMVSHLQDYGFPVSQLNQLVDHRWQRYVRDNMLREKRVREALAKVRKAAPAKEPASKATGKPPKKGAPLNTQKTRKHASKLEAIFSNID